MIVFPDSMCSNSRRRKARIYRKTVTNLNKLQKIISQRTTRTNKGIGLRKTEIKKKITMKIMKKSKNKNKNKN